MDLLKANLREKQGARHLMLIYSGEVEAGRGLGDPAEHVQITHWEGWGPLKSLPGCPRRPPASYRPWLRKWRDS